MTAGTETGRRFSVITFIVDNRLSHETLRQLRTPCLIMASKSFIQYRMLAKGTCLSGYKRIANVYFILSNVRYMLYRAGIASTILLLSDRSDSCIITYPRSGIYRYMFKIFRIFNFDSSFNLSTKLRNTKLHLIPQLFGGWLVCAQAVKCFPTHRPPKNVHTIHFIFGGLCQKGLKDGLCLPLADFSSNKPKGRNISIPTVPREFGDSTYKIVY
jgi:hypothetical protein